MSDQDICFLPATELARRIRSRELSAVEVMQAHLAQIERVNPLVNAIITLLPERALEGARAADAALARGDAVGPLHGLPIAHKDLLSTKGIRTTSGSPISSVSTEPVKTPGDDAASGTVSVFPEGAMTSASPGSSCIVWRAMSRVMPRPAAVSRSSSSSGSFISQWAMRR